MADEYDLILYLDADTMILGRAQAAIDLAAPRGTAPYPVTAVRDMLYAGKTFNAGVMVIRTSHQFFIDMMKAGKTLKYNPDFAEQAFLNEYLSKTSGWGVLSPICNLLTTRVKKESTNYDPVSFSHLESALVLHYAGDCKVRSWTAVGWHEH
jgi:lipopolysaccharide biosynthesis glycosyltransferase